MPETTQSDLVARLRTTRLLSQRNQMELQCEAAAEIERLRKAADRLQKIESQTDGGGFDKWPTETFVGQLRMQARDNLDPEYSHFMTATANRMESLRAHCGVIDRLHVPRTLDQWSDDDGDVLWHLMPICQPPWVGTPQDTEWPFAEEDEARLWWTRLPDCNEIHKRWKEGS